MVFKAYDPGVNSMFVCVTQGDSREQPQIVRMSGKEFHHIRQTRKAAKWREKKLHAAPNNLEHYITSLPIKKVASVQGARSYTASLTARLQQIPSHYGSWEHRRWSFQNYNRGQAALQVGVQRITGRLPAHRVVVGAGDAGAGWHRSCISRRSMGSCKELLRKLRPKARVMDVSEYKTSQKCSAFFPLADSATYAAFDAQLRKSQSWDRDVCAARNILRCMMAVVDGVPQLEALRGGQQVQVDLALAELVEPA